MFELAKFCIECHYTVLYGDENKSYKAEGIWAPECEFEELDEFQCEGCGEYFTSATSWLCAKVG